MWRWLERFRQDHLKPALADWGPDAVVWDGTGAHRGKRPGELPVARVFLPPYNSELNPAERVFQKVRRRVERRRHATLYAKQAEEKAYLAELAADPARVKRLCAWSWISAALDALPAAATSPA